MYNRIIAKKKLSTSFQLASLPPTSAAAEQHSYRVYLQVQEWLGNCLDPTKWGWSMIEKSLKPIPTTKEVAPLKLLQLQGCMQQEVQMCTVRYALLSNVWRMPRN